MANALKNLFADIATAIREKTGEEGTMKPIDFPSKISGISAGSSALVKYVTFMSEDGTTELFKMPVLIGDDCKDPVTHGDISTPTKESTNAYDYTHSGWSLTSGGNANSSALENVTEDRVVYASYSASARYYTVNFYDEDGTTLLHTVETTYGANVSNIYTPTKGGYIFNGWNPSVNSVTGDINTCATWKPGVSFATSSWEDIVQAIDRGELDSFAVGDKRTESFAITGGSDQTVNMKIIGIQHDTLSDGSGKASLSIIASSSYQVSWNLFTGSESDWSTSQWRSKINGYVENMPTILKNNIKEVQKEYYKSDRTTKAISIDKGWAPSATELGLEYSKALVEGEKYEAYATVSGIGSSYKSSDLYLEYSRGYLTRTISKPTIGYSIYVHKNNYFGERSSTGTADSSNCLVFGFCL